MLSIFMYHRILPKPYSGAILPEMFERQLDYLQNHYYFLTPEEVIDYIRLGKDPSHGKPCAALTFDDGWADNLFYATPILKARNLRSTVAISVGCMYDGPCRSSETDDVLYQTPDWKRSTIEPGDPRIYASCSELAAMVESGVWKLEAHGTRHILGDAGASRLAIAQNGLTQSEFEAMLHDDIANSCRQLEERCHVKPDMFFWPWGHYSKSAVKVAAQFGLLQFTVSKGSIHPGDKREVLPRIGVPPRWKKFCKNCFVFRHPTLSFLHDFFHTEKVLFDEPGSVENE